MNIRLMGLPAECDKAVAIIYDATMLTVTQVDGPYPNRGDSRLVRFYIQVHLPPDDGAVP